MCEITRRPANAGRATLLVAAAAIAVHATPLSAQSAPGDIVVTAEVTKSGVPLSQTPQSVTIVDRSQLDQLDVRTIEEALRYTPSVQAETGGRVGYDNIYIRGFQQSAYEYKDGLRLDPGYLTQQEEFGLERLEVLKGPASVLYGQISPGGLVNLTSKQPIAHQRAELFVEGGSFGQFAAGADVGGALAKDDKLLWRIEGVYRRRDDFQNYVGSARVFISPSLSWRPNDATSLTLIGVYQEDRYRRSTGLPVQGSIVPNVNGPVDRTFFAGEPSVPRFDGPQRQITALFEQRMALGWTFRQRVRYNDYDDNGGYVTGTGLEADQRTLDRFGITFRIHARVLSTDTQVEGVFRTGQIEHRVLAGFDYLYNYTYASGYFLNAQPLDVYRPVYTGAPITGDEMRNDSVLEQYHPYAQYRGTIADHYVVVGGIGYGATSNRGYDFVAEARTRQDDHKLIGSGALLWIAPAGFTPYVSYAQSFEPQVGVDPLQNGKQPPPTQGTQVEGGIKWAAPGGRATITLAVFDIELKNVVNDIFGAPSYSVLTGKQRNSGVEIEGDIRPFDALSLRAGYTHLHARVEDSTNGDVGLTPQNVPADAASGFATLDGKAFGLAGADVGAGVRYEGKRRGNGNTDVLPGFTLVDLAAHYRLAGFELGLNVKNLFDCRYFAGADFQGVVPGEPRSVQASLRRRF